MGVENSLSEHVDLPEVNETEGNIRFERAEIDGSPLGLPEYLNGVGNRGICLVER